MLEGSDYEGLNAQSARHGVSLYELRSEYHENGRLLLRLF
jgi:hypothetical protein